MASLELTKQYKPYAQWHRILWLMLAVLSVVSALLIWNAQGRNNDAQALQTHLMKGSVTGAAHEITLRVKTLRTAVSLFAEKERVLLKRLAKNPEDVDIYSQLLDRIKEYFTDGFAVTLADDRGDPVVMDFDGFVGQLCQADLRSFTQHALITPEIYIHPNTIGYHFDVMVPVELDSHRPYIFFISFFPKVFSEILSRHQLYGHRLLLVNREINGLIEVDASGSRDAMNRDHYLSDAERARVQARARVDETRWTLLDVPEVGAVKDASEAVWQETAMAIVALFAISLFLLYSLRHHVNQIEAQNSKLRVQADEIHDRSEKVINILERTTDAYLEFDADWRCIYINRQAGKLLEYAPELVLGHDIWDALPELASTFYKRMQKARADGLTYVFEGFYPPSKRWIETHVYPLPDRMTVFMRDVTQERLAWDQAKNAEVRVRTILDNVADAIVVIDQNGVIETFNTAAERMFGYSADEALGANVSRLMPSSYSEQHNEFVARYRRTQQSKTMGQNRELTGLRKDGTEFPVEICVTHVNANERDFFVAALRDISERCRAEERIRELAKFPDESPSPILRIGSDGIVIYANRPAEVLLHSWDTTTGGDVTPRVLQMVCEALAAGVPIERESRCYDRIFSLVFSPVQEGHYVSVYGRDVTDRKNIEQEIKNHRDRLEELVSERTAALAMAHNDALVANRAKSAFLASMSHELRTPLNAIIGYAEMLEDDARDDGHNELRMDLAKITASGRHLLTIINDILDLSKIEAGKTHFTLEHFFVENLLIEIDNAIQPMVAKNHNRYDVVVDGDIGAMYSDVTRLKQILLNLLSNACKFTRNGRITLMVRRETDDDRDWLSFVVNDTGIGMTAEQMGRIFQPFTQADSSVAIKYGGTGLGLAISRRICQLLGGEIHVNSDMGVGSNFIVRLPVETVPQTDLVAT